MKIINNDNYKEIFGKGIHLIEIAGDQCSGCVALNPVVVELVKKHDYINHYYINVTHNNYKFIEEYKIQKVPALILIADSELIGQVSGYQPPEILEIWLEDKLESIKKQ